MNETYLATARLLTEVAPTAFASGLFALKGGTAINLFLREMPRLSVDLDLVFTDLSCRCSRLMKSMAGSILFPVAKDIRLSPPAGIAGNPLEIAESPETGGRKAREIS